MEGFKPHVHPGRLPAWITALALAAGALQLLKSAGHLEDAGVGKVGQANDARQLESARGLGNKLTDGDRIEMQIAQHAAAVLYGDCRQFRALGHELSNQVKGLSSEG